MAEHEIALDILAGVLGNRFVLDGVDEVGPSDDAPPPDGGLPAEFAVDEFLAGLGPQKAAADRVAVGPSMTERALNTLRGMLQSTRAAAEAAMEAPDLSRIKARALVRV